jgi:hypothetical protein
MRTLFILASLILSSCGEVPNYTITCDGPKYGQVAIMINDGCPAEYRKRP